MAGVINRVATDVAPELFKEPGVGITQGSKVELLGPAFLGIELPEVKLEVGAEVGDGAIV